MKRIQLADPPCRFIRYVLFKWPLSRYVMNDETKIHGTEYYKVPICVYIINHIQASRANGNT